MHSTRVTWAANASSATRRIAPSGKVAMTMILVKWIFETSGAVHVSSTLVELQAGSASRVKAARAVAARWRAGFAFMDERRFLRARARTARIARVKLSWNAAAGYGV